MPKQPSYSPTKIRIIQHNCNRSSLVINTLLDFAVGTADLLLPQEPGFNPDNTFITTHSGFELLISPKNLRKHNRAIAYLAKNNPYIKCSPRTDISQDPDIQITVFNIYNEHEGSSNIYTIPRSFTNIPLPERYIIAGDMNAHHSWWNSQTKTPKRADEIVQIMETNNFSLLNEPDTPIYYYRTGKGTSIIDLAFTSQAIHDSVINWAVEDNASTGSDHATI
ncbi:DNase I-like protein [Wilcoxina mikolae CBS 423.85]|nr:DNase I-like protein [Wilcoxina mikolae CBS 423.85]